MDAKKRYKVILERAGCIGATSCVVMYPERWVLNKNDDKVDLIGGKVEDERREIWSIEITENELEKFRNSAEVCPVNVIHIINLETGEKLV